MTDPLSQLQEKLEKKEGAVNRFQRRSWLVFYFILLLAYLFSLGQQYPSLFKILEFFQSYSSFGLEGWFFMGIIAFMVLQLGLGVYQLWRRRWKLGSVSLAAGLLFFFFFLRGDRLFFSQLHAQWVMMIAAGFNLLLLGTGVAVSLLYYRKMGKLSFVFPLIFIILALVAFVPHYQRVTSYQQQLEGSSEEYMSVPLLEKAPDTRKALKRELKAVIWTLPPLGRANLANLFTVRNQAFNDYYKFSSRLTEILRSYGMWHTALDSPNEVCGGTWKHWQEQRLQISDWNLKWLYISRFEDQLFYEQLQLKIYQRRRPDYVALIRTICRERDNCDLSEINVARNYDRYVNRRRQELEFTRKVLRDLAGSELRLDYSSLFIPNCSTPSYRPKYGLRLKNISCGSQQPNQLNFTLEWSRGPQPHEAPGFRAVIYQRDFPYSRPYTFSHEDSQTVNYTRFSSKQEVKLSFNTSKASLHPPDLFLAENRSFMEEHERYQGFSFQPGKKYGIKIKSDYGDFLVYAFCEGGNSFYQD